MPSEMLQNAEQGLADAALMAGPPISTATLADALARPVLVHVQEEPLPTPRRVVITGPQGLLSSRRALGPSLRRSISEAVELLKLPAGWNSYSAKPVKESNVVRAIALLVETIDPGTRPPVIIPTVRGGLQLEWHANGVDIEIYVDAPDEVSFFAEDLDSGESTEQPLLDHEPELKSWLERVSQP